MSFKENLAAQFEGFSVKAPTISQHLGYLFADYVELISLFSNDCFVTASDILDRLQDEGILNKKEDEESLEDGSISSEENDRLEIWVDNVFKILEDRALLFASDYPFFYHPTKLLLQKNLNYKQQLYISLLLSSNLNLFDKVRPDLTSEFETISFCALKNYLPGHAIVKQFGKQSDYVGNAKTKIKSLAKDLRMTVDDYELNNISERNNQEKGLDIIGWIPFSDYCGNQVTILGQCACGKEWYSKHHDTKRYVHYLNFYRMNPHHAMFIPYSLINYPDNKFYSSDEVEENTLLFERKRIIEYFNDESVFDNLNSKIIVEKCLSYQEDIV